MRLTKLGSISVLALWAVAACGGGGGNGTTPTPVPVVTPTPTPTPTPATFTVTGSTTTASSFKVDSDINDSVASPVSNNSFAFAQPISNDARVTGFVVNSVSGGTGFVDEDNNPIGNFQSTNDSADFFEVELFEDQVVFVEFVRASEVNSLIDVDLVLYDESGNQVSASLSANNPFEQIIVPSSGTYFIEVRAFNGSEGALYSLSVQTELGTAQYTQVNTNSFMPGEAALKGKPRSVEGTSMLRDVAEKGVASLSAEGVANSTFKYGDVVRFKTDVSADKNDASIKAASEEKTLYQQRIETLEAIKAFNAAEGEDLAVPMFIPQISASDPTPDVGFQWNMYDVAWPQMRQNLAQVTLEKTPVIAVIDSGFFTSHPDLAPRIIDQREFVPASVDGDGFQAEAEEEVDPGDLNPNECHSFHGTHVASTAVSPINNEGIVGVAPEADLIAIKIGYSIGDECSGLPGNLADAIRYAAGLPTSTGIQLPTAVPRADVINLSLGALGELPAAEAAINDAVAQGVVVVAAAGNDGDGPDAQVPNFPAAYDNVIAVAATDFNRERSYFSSFYPQVAIAAPGGDATVDANGDGNGDFIVAAGASLENGSFVADYLGLQGTSMATPHVAGGIAMMRSVNAGLSPSDINQLLVAGSLTNDVGDAGRDPETGYGIMSLTKMLNAAVETADDPGAIPTSISVSPSAANFGRSVNALTLNATRFGTGDLSITSADTIGTVSWLSIAPDDVDSDGLGSYVLTVDRTGLANGQYSATVRFVLSDANVIDINASALVTSVSDEAETGPYYALIQRRDDNDEFETVEQFNGINGVGQDFRFGDLTEGEYRILAGTDLDHDNLICDLGELCVSHPGPESLTGTFSLDGNEFGLRLNFLYEGRTNISSTAAKEAEESESPRGYERLSVPLE